jgi:hypothetical protein
MISGCSSEDACGWHYGYPYGGRFAVIYNPASNRKCLLQRSPNGDAIADSEINAVSHELFESVTDPALCRSWATNCRVRGNEIGDLCVRDFGTTRPDGSNVILHGHQYRLQEEWSNRDGRCVLPSGPLASTGSASSEPVGVLAGSIIVGLLLILLAVLVLRGWDDAMQRV